MAQIPFCFPHSLVQFFVSPHIHGYCIYKLWGRMISVSYCTLFVCTADFKPSFLFLFPSFPSHDTCIISLSSPVLVPCIKYLGTHSLLYMEAPHPNSWSHLTLLALHHIHVSRLPYCVLASNPGQNLHKREPFPRPSYYPAYCTFETLPHFFLHEYSSLAGKYPEWVIICIKISK